VIRVIIADDSATARTLLRSIIEGGGDMRVIAEAKDGADAIRLVQQHRPDLVIMDVHMPVADGLAATKEIMMRVPTPILIVSAVSRRDVDLSLSATQAGALMALPKPGDPTAPRFHEAAAELLGMARAMAGVKVVRRWSASAPAPTLPSPARRSREGAELVAIAASTGGPGALRRVLMDLPQALPAPLLVVQHIARDFTAGFASWLASGCPLPVKIPEAGEQLRAGVVYIAPDDRHLGVTADGRVRLDDGAPMGGFRPSATHLFESAGRAYGERLVAVMLTGMGTDGVDGLEAAHDAGAYVLAQDEASSVVYGMAQEAVRRGVVHEVAPLEQLATRIVELVAREAHAG
jgi:two-component system, chemotaxis family, protein-glutamate methylesterase/glutaminase